MMAKKNKKQWVGPEMGSRGCMPRLISIFESRRAHSMKKLLSDSRGESSGSSSSTGKVDLPANGSQGVKSLKGADQPSGLSDLERESGVSGLQDPQREDLQDKQKQIKTWKKWKSIPRAQEERIRKIFHKKQKSADGKDIYDRIVVLKATPPVSSRTAKPFYRDKVEREEDRFNSHFSLKEVKRRLKHAVRDYRRDHRVWFLRPVLHTNKENAAWRSREEIPSKGMSIASASSPQELEYEFQREARKHLAEMLDSLNDDLPSPAEPPPSRPLGRLLSLSENDAQFPKNSEGIVSRGISSPEHVAELMDEKRDEGIPRSLSVLESMESIAEKPERPSPVSVLEPLFSEEDSSPAVDFLDQLRHIRFDEHEESAGRKTFVSEKIAHTEYVRRILEASGLMQRELSERWRSSSPMLDPSLYDEVEYPSAEFPDDLQLLFDSASEVLEEMREKFFYCTPKLSFGCPFPAEEKLIDLVLKGINVNSASRPPDSLEQIMEKDLARWMELRPEIESIAAILEDAILDDRSHLAGADHALRRRNATPTITAAAAAAAPAASVNRERSPWPDKCPSSGRGGAVGCIASALSSGGRLGRSIPLRSSAGGNPQAPAPDPRSHRIRAETMTTPRNLPEGVSMGSTTASAARPAATGTEDKGRTPEPTSLRR